MERRKLSKGGGQMVTGRLQLEMSSIEMRQAYFKALLDVALRDPRIFVIDCDLSHSVGSAAFAERLPGQYLNCGIQEANAVGVAAGLSLRGFIPFVHTFGVFASRRVMDQVYLSCAYAKLNVKIVGADPGITAEANGGTHMAMEDAGIMRLIPGVRVMEPSDVVMMDRVVRMTACHKGVDYIRMRRKKAERIYDDGVDFESGRGVLLREGNDVTIIAAGLMVSEALKSARNLEAGGISVRVVDMYCLKPLDRELIIESARRTGAIVTAENHNLIGGLGSGVADIVVRNCPVPMECVGVDEAFGEVGNLQYLQKRFGLTEENITKACLKVLGRKNEGCCR